jgi:hypothetical protein
MPWTETRWIYRWRDPIADVDNEPTASSGEASRDWFYTEEEAAAALKEEVDEYLDRAVDVGYSDDKLAQQRKEAAVEHRRNQIETSVEPVEIEVGGPFSIQTYYPSSHGYSRYWSVFMKGAYWTRQAARAVADKWLKSARATEPEAYVKITDQEGEEI